MEILWKVARFFGTEDIKAYIQKYGLIVDGEIEQRLMENKLKEKKILKITVFFKKDFPKKVGRN